MEGPNGSHTEASLPGPFVCRAVGSSAHNLCPVEAFSHGKLLLKDDTRKQIADHRRSCTGISQEGSHQGEQEQAHLELRNQLGKNKTTSS
ncbi:hypothetical protein TNCT_690951 [Trichonephila clavata]|uniref:Uncharacterized protein n=1 Tax=Trichonephila clavata TaxID=2740835 RepID=A0A8X6KPU7_TRICU|nr:hypothetical protein TNCT_690951 [Trichonephila clavata]